ncbi:hypothetical protein P0082_05565 [Candidatus Haliotispira prima]|uniref:Uncharacterized protein n=1 Tax=Candidatus Haliotispira prima TaxID=3034016 RepID=A0ABY8MMC2_9SPIO|nr:hypothetical protein P0082_05565 [Candidatus Haliotispira prima]
MNIHILVSTFGLCVLLYMAKRLASLAAKTSEPIRLGDAFARKLSLLALLVTWPLSLSSFLPISYYLFVRSQDYLIGYIVLHPILLVLTVCYLVDFRLRSRGRQNSQQIYLVYILFLFAMYLLGYVVGLLHSKDEQQQPYPQALVSYSTLRLIHWCSLIIYVYSTAGLLFCHVFARNGLVPKKRSRAGLRVPPWLPPWLLLRWEPQKLLRRLLLLTIISLTVAISVGFAFSLYDIYEAFREDCHTLWCPD